MTWVAVSHFDAITHFTPSAGHALSLPDSLGEKLGAI